MSSAVARPQPAVVQQAAAPFVQAPPPAPQQTQPQQQQTPAPPIPNNNNNNANSQQAQQARAIAEKLCTEFSEFFAWDERTAKEHNIKYFLVRIIGQGASATVLQIRRTTDNAPFALKFVDLSTMQEADKNRARHEIDCLVSCDIFTVVRCHEEFVKFHSKEGVTGKAAVEAMNATVQSYGGGDESAEDALARPQPPPDADINNPRLFALVLDYANAGDLRMEIKNRSRANRPFREHEAGLLFLQVLMAVHHVHSRHMIHRDIKSANVLLCTNGLLKLGDFGFSRIYHNVSVSENVGRTFCGTPYYVAPEIWRRKPYSKKADIFSIGVLLYELLTLKRPFDGVTVQDVMEKALSGQYDPLPETISPEMRSLVHMLLSDDPDVRPSTKQLLRLPISKLFLDALIGIILTQPTFEEPLRTEIKEHIRIIRESTTDKERLKQRLTLAAAGAPGQSPSNASTSVISYPDVTGIALDQNDILCEGYLRKLSIDGSWKKRYLCIVHRRTTPPVDRHAVGDRRAETIGGACGLSQTISVPEAAHALGAYPPREPPEHYDLVLAVTRENAQQQCIITNFSELEDVFPVPYKYAGPGLAHVFAIAFKSGVKRLTFQAPTQQENDAWRAAILHILGLDSGDDTL